MGTSMLEAGSTYDASGNETESIIETEERSDSCADCGEPVPTMSDTGCAVYEMDGTKGDTTGVQRCADCSRMFHGAKWLNK